MVAKPSVAAFCSYPGCCPLTGLAAVESRDAPFLIWPTTQLNMGPVGWGRGQERHTWSSVWLPPLVEVKTTTVCSCCQEPWGQERWMAFTHPLNRRNPDSSTEQAREGKRESALAWGRWGMDYLFFRVQLVSKESVSGRQRDPEHTELGPAETRFCLPRAGCCGFDRLETRTWQKHHAFML